MAPPSKSKHNMRAASAAAIFLLLSVASAPFAGAIGVNYGTKGDNLPPPATVASFLANRTRINRVKLFDTNPDIVRAFAGTGISLVVTAGNGDIPALATTNGAAAAWVAANVAPYYPATDISLVAVGNEIMDTGDPSLIGNLVPAMRSLRSALVAAGYRRIRVSTPHSLGVLAAPPPPAPSAGRFRAVDDLAVIRPMLEFHRATRSPFMVNAYPYFGYNGDTVGYALSRPRGPGNPGVRDPGSGVTYTSMFEAQLDAVFSAMKALGFEDVEIAVGETGWPTKAMDGQAGVGPDEAAEYNRYLIREASGGSGTPLMPKRTFETYIFALFNEDLKPGPVAERNFGMFLPDLTPVYDVGLMKDAVKTAPAPAAAMASTSNATTKLDSEDAAAPPPAEPKPANGSSKAPAPSSGEEAAGPAPSSEGGSTEDNEKTPEDEAGDAPAEAAAGDPAGGESSEAEAEDDDAEGSSTEKTPRTTPSPAGASSGASSLVSPISTMLTTALSLALSM